MSGKNDLSGRRVLLVIAPKGFRDEELFEPQAALEARGAEVTVASTSTEAAKGMMGEWAHPDRTIDGCSAAEFDAIAVVGGSGSPQHLWKYAPLLGLLRDAAEGGKVVAGICLSAAVLANAGVLEGKRATVYRTHESLAAFVAGGVTRIDEPLVVDGAIVTGEGPAVARAFGDAIGDAIVAAVRPLRV